MLNKCTDYSVCNCWQLHFTITFDVVQSKNAGMNLGRMYKDTGCKVGEGLAPPAAGRWIHSNVG